MTIESALARLRVGAPYSIAERVLAGVDLADEYVSRPSPLGMLFVAFNARGVCAVDLAPDAGAFEAAHAARYGRPAVAARRLPPAIERHLDTAIARGSPGRLPVDLSALSEFQISVLETTASIPQGEVRPYSWVAAEIGRPEAVRAVGTALARNPVPVIIPCHRVVRTDGAFGRYSLGADENKPRLLEAEGLDVDEFRRLAGRGVRYLGSDTTRIFCHPTCRAARTIADAHRVEFADAQAANRAGYRPCFVCRPARAA
jgi:O-6-methylguanine DNA methyltransferase